ncbi:MAG: hypothetical protein A2430_00820 [Candidatus Liptonbacteria bacterium RIFOXYC1_FULL_36_8]|uniref:Type 4 fimbrial biogenesis protein PilO n=2 Tax=Candidatus Liptoniibacteriota TaxID=1817909 RepID=A0A1G2CSF8_9BACT|nr:MAG: hypothetical protein A2390_03140 [Candidatus Liptonbacteria bacterium RIFOXYB1_FULL_36_10]OGZ03848.1 MAG: hypothetical protein A2430_00820 [Candidatus Liptonbacteria bacterium RIFOXYC1_FULL_36_8]
MSPDKTVKILKQAIGISALIFSAIIITEIALVFFLRSSISSKATEAETVNSSIRTKAGDVEQRSALRSEAAEAAPLNASLKNILSNKDSLLGLSKDLNDTANLYSVNLAFSFTGEVEEKKDPYGKAGFSMTVDGEYGKIVNFLKKINSGRFIFDISNIDIQNREGTNIFRLLAHGYILYRK